MTMTNTNGDITVRLNSLKSQIDKGKTEKTRAEANLESYTKQRDEVVAEMQELGVTPETVDAEIERLDKKIEESLKQAEELLRG
jgi:chromosome segregation ATPase